MPPGERVCEKSVLDKPLHLLTEDDISQLTREDCRRYLKQKGMRRPSWNKSQAIQQVISLKTLLETTRETDSTATRKKLYAPRLRNGYVIADINNSPRTASTEKSPNLSEARAPAPYERNDMEMPTVSGHHVAPASDCNPLRNSGSDNIPVGQMAIFYCGKVNVYDDIAADKARTILHLAASQLPLPQDAPSVEILALPPASHTLDRSTKVIPDSIAFPTSQTEWVRRQGCLEKDASSLMNILT